MNRGAALTWGTLAASAALVVAGSLKQPPAEEQKRPAVAVTPDVPMADRPRSGGGIHPTDQGGDPDPAATRNAQIQADMRRLVREKLHRYDSVKDGEFSYRRQASDDDRSRGVAQMRPLKIRYLGRTSTGAYLFTSTSIGAYHYLWCSDPCTVMQAGFAGGGQTFRTELDARAPSILHAVYVDASNGSLDFAISPGATVAPPRTVPPPATLPSDSP